MNDDAARAADVTPAGTQPDVETSKAAARSLSQEDLDREIGKRLAVERRRWERESAKLRDDAIAAWRDEHGLDDEALERVRRGDSASELRAARAAATKLEKRAAEAEAKAASVAARLHDTMARSAVVSAASAAVDPDDVWLRLRDRLRVTDSFEIEVVDERGEPSEESVQQLVDGLLAAKPHLARPTGAASGSGSRPIEPGAAAARSRSSDLMTSAGRLAILEQHRDLFRRG